jgi:flagellin-like hook-associated protein FlgL
MEVQTKTEPLPIKNVKPNNDSTKLRFNNGFKLTDKQIPQDLSMKTKLLARLPKSPNLGNIIQNNNDIISMVQTADEAMKSIGSITEAIKGNLAGNGSNNAPTQESIHDMASEANKIVHETVETSFASSLKLLDGSFGFRTVKIGEDPKDTITFSMPDLRKWAEKLQKIDTKSNIQEALATVDSVLARVTSERSKLSALLDRLFNARYSQEIVVEQMGIRPPIKSLWSSQQEIQCSI